MSGDVQPRKRKDKKRKKDDLGVDEPRGTAAILGEGDVFMHSQHDHGTGGHWCAKIIFFSLLAILVTLIGLIILENRGLSELEANAVESRYSGVLEGWLEDAPEDDHHDVHTLDLKHHDDDDDGHEDIDQDEHDDQDEDEHDDEYEHNDEEEHGDIENEEDEHDEDEEDKNQQDVEEQDVDTAEDEDEDDRSSYSRYFGGGDEDDAENDDNDDEDNDDEDNDDEDNDIQDDEDDTKEDDLNDNDEDDEQYVQRYDDDDESNEQEKEDDEDHEVDEDDEDEEDKVEVEKIEKEASEEEEPISTELPALPEADDDDETNEVEEEPDQGEEDASEEEPQDQIDDDADDFLEADDDEPPIERITAPAGKPFEEVEEEVSSERPPDTLEEEEEYEKKQEELKREEERSSHKDGGNSVEDEWPGEPSDPFWREQLDSAERELRQGEWSSAAQRAGAAQLQASARARWVAAVALDRAADARRDNALLSRAIAAYIHLLKMNERLSDEKLLQIANRTLDRIQFRGNYLNAEPVYRLLIRRFPDDPTYRNKLCETFLMANRVDLAEEVLKETLSRWPEDKLALAYYGFVLKSSNRLEEAVDAFQKALKGDEGPACTPRFYYNLGDALLLLGRYSEANEVHKRGAKHGHFLSPAQRSLYNVPRLKGQPWWDVEQTPYVRLARALEKSWRDILKEGEAAQTLYEKEKEGLKERGEWSQLDLFVRGQEIPSRCKRAPVTCNIVKSEPAAVTCRRGQIKFSAMEPGTHVRPHVGPTNCRLRMHLGLSNTKDTYLRVDKETRQWQEGKVLLFDDSFEHEVWHNGTGKRLVLIVDVWHPELTPKERHQLPAI